MNDRPYLGVCLCKCTSVIDDNIRAAKLFSGRELTFHTAFYIRLGQSCSFNKSCDLNVLI